MPSLIGTSVAANYRQQIVPFSRFGTRKVVWYKIGSLDVDSENGVLDMALFNTVIDCIQTRAEIVMVGAPYIVNDSGWNKFMVAVFEDTFNDGPNNDITGVQHPNTQATTLEQALQEVTGNSSVNVQQFYLYGAPATNHNSYDGWSVNDIYQEYATKTEFEEYSYTTGNP